MEKEKIDSYFPDIEGNDTPSSSLFEGQLQESFTESAIAKSIAEEAHKDDKRRGGAPYIGHIYAVAAAVSEKAKPVAYIHDVMEDHPEQYSEKILLERGLSEETVRAATLLNKNVYPGISYEDYIHLIKTNSLSKEVKLADIRHNLSDSPSERQILKYEKALRILNN